MSARSVDEPLSMLSYWLEDKGIEEVFKEYYPNLLNADPMLCALVAQYVSAKAAIETACKRLSDEAKDDEPD